jgi:hypothetical protein
VDAHDVSTNSLENQRTVFHSVHKALFAMVRRGHFYFVKDGDTSISP